MHNIKIIYFTTLLFMISNCQAQKSRELLFYNIPPTSIDLYKSIHIEDTSFFCSSNAFKISEFITLAEYKEFLKDMKRDSSAVFYEKQLPNIKTTTLEKIQEYLTEEKYENYPVVGISWYSAMEFCKWKTVKENPDTLQFIYRLPSTFEWLVAFTYFNENNIENDFNQKYADWLLNSAGNPLYLDLKFWKNDNLNLYKLKQGTKFNRILSNKLVIGNSFVKKNKHIIDFNTYYASEGFKHIAFRVIKENIHKSPLIDGTLVIGSNDIRFKQDDFSFGNSIAEHCLDYWEWKK